MALTAMLGLTLTAGPALAWGKEGHQVIAAIAAAHLSPEARANIAALLPKGDTLVSISTWADEVRPSRPETKPWHYINIPIRASRRDSTVYCPKTGCVTGKILEFTASLKDGELPHQRRADALKYLVHFVGDLHQPLHASDDGDRGGNDRKLTFFGQASNLHRVWDGGILWKMDLKASAAAEFDREIKGSDRKKWARGGVEDWVWESQQVSRRSVYGLLPKSSRTPLGEEYQRRAEPVVRMQSSRAGVRLAALLNEIWSSR